MSGLITPSLDEMVAIAAEMERRGMKIPLLLGGATTSKAHTAVKVQPQYSGPVVHAADASQGVLLVNALMNPDTRDEFIAETQAEYAAIRAESGEKHAPLLSLEEARANAFRPDWSVTPNEMPRHPGITDLAGEPLEEIIPYIDWDMFLNTWEIDTEAAAHTREELMRDARALLEKIRMEKLFRCSASAGLYPAVSVQDDIEVYRDSSRTEVLARLPMLRQQLKKNTKNPNLSLADYLPQKGSGFQSWMDSSP